MTRRDESIRDTLPVDDGTAEVTASGSPTSFTDLGTIGAGAMGEVRRVRDVQLNRVLAMKIVRPEIAASRGALARFVEEAQATAQLEHPGIVPVHQLGQLPDGRWFFTMKEVQGVTFTAAIDALHDASGPGFWGTSPQGWTFYKLLDAFHGVCEAMAYAHQRGVLHRDLKPDNVMLGEHGEVLVLDWGLAKVGNKGEHVDDEVAVVTARSLEGSFRTRLGTIAGTPAYMSPEQARGEIDRLDARSDVWALGAMLYDLLAGQPPFVSMDAMVVLEQVRSGNVPTLTPGPAAVGNVPEELARLAAVAMSFDREGRPPHAGALSEAIGAFLEGAHEREKALLLVEQAESSMPRMRSLRASADRARRSARRLLEGVRPFDPLDRKRAAWAEQDEAERLEGEADLAEVDVVQKLQGALTHAPDLPEAHDRLAQLYRERHADAEIRRDRPGARRYEALLAAHDLTGAHAGWLRGDGHLSMVTEPACEAELYRFEEHDRRLVPTRIANVGRSPLDLPLSMGSYLVVFKAAGCADLAVPVHIGRAERVDFVRPGGSAVPIALPKVGELGADDIFVAPGSFLAGGDPEAGSSIERRAVWVDGFVIQRFPVTNTDYIAFLDDLVQSGQGSEAERHAPRDRSGHAIYGRSDDGRFVLVPDSEGDVWAPDWPVLLVDHASATAFAAWVARRTGRPWRLPTELEWEKAARGVDGRYLPWGDHFDATWACVRDSHRGKMLPAPITAFPDDVGPYGVRHMGGNARCWCLDAFRNEEPEIVDGIAPIVVGTGDLRSTRGSAWSTPAVVARTAFRQGTRAEMRLETIGIRLVYSRA